MYKEISPSITTIHLYRFVMSSENITDKWFFVKYENMYKANGWNVEYVKYAHILNFL